MKRALVLPLLLPALSLAQTVTYTISTIAGNNGSGAGFSGDGGAAVNAQLYQPVGLAVDKNGNLFIADQINNVIRQVTPDGNIKTVAGKNSVGFSGDNGAATSAQLYNPTGVAFDSSGNLYVADYNNDVIRKFTVGGNISTYAGSNAIFLQNGYALGGLSGDG
jgi:hypothetical protein